MSTVFRTPFLVWRRRPGTWEDGRYTSETLLDPISVRMTVQEPSSGDRNMIETSHYGRREARYIKIYCDQKLSVVSQEPNGNPGDIVAVSDRQYLLFGESVFHSMKRINPSATVSHYRYFGVETIEHAPGEVVP